MTGYSECRDVPSPPHPGEAEWRMVSLGGWSREPQCRVAYAHVPGPPPRLCAWGVGYEFGFTCLRPSPRRNPTGSKSPGSGSF